MILRHTTGELLVPPSAVWCIAFGVLYGAFVCFAQAMRLYIHLVSWCTHLPPAGLAAGLAPGVAGPALVAS
jgi:hypothetical protein